MNTPVNLLSLLLIKNWILIFKSEPTLVIGCVQNFYLMTPNKEVTGSLYSLWQISTMESTPVLKNSFNFKIYLNLLIFTFRRGWTRNMIQQQIDYQNFLYCPPTIFIKTSTQFINCHSILNHPSTLCFFNQNSKTSFQKEFLLQTLI